MPPGLPDHILRQSFQFSLNTHFSWWDEGHEHVRAAGVLLEKSWQALDEREEVLDDRDGTIEPGTEEYEIVQNSFLYKQATLLLAYGIENMLKASWVAQNHHQIEDRLPSQIHRHDLNDLADQVGLSLTPQEDEALATLSSHSIWAGRYPIPTRTEAYVDQHGEIDRMWIVSEHPGPVSFPDEVSSLLEKIWASIQDALKLN